MPHQSVEERVAGRVTRLTRTAERTRHRREHHERREIQLPGRLVQVPGRVDLGTQHTRKPLTRQRLHHTVVQHTRRMHHGPQRTLRRDPGQQPVDRPGLGKVASLYRHPRTQPGQLRDQTVHALGSRTTTTHQQQIAHATLGHQMTGHHTTQATRTTRHQNRAVNPGHIPGRRPIAARLRRHPRQTRHRHLTTTHRHLGLGLTHGQRHLQRLGRQHHTRLDIQQTEPPRMLQPCGTHQAPDGPGRQVLGAVGGGDHEHQTARREAVVRQPLLDQLEGPRGRRLRGFDDLGRVRHGDEHRPGHFVLGQCFQVGNGDQPVRTGGEHAEAVAAQQCARGRGGSSTASPGRDPVHEVEGLRTAPRPTGLGDGPYDKGFHRGDRFAGRVGQLDGQGVPAHPGEPGAQCRRTGRVQTHPFPGEGHALRPVALTEGEGGVQGGVEERRVQAEGATVDVVVQGDLGEDLVAPAPGGP